MVFKNKEIKNEQDSIPLKNETIATPKTREEVEKALEVINHAIRMGQMGVQNNQTVLVSYNIKDLEDSYFRNTGPYKAPDANIHNKWVDYLFGFSREISIDKFKSYDDIIEEQKKIKEDKRERLKQEQAAKLLEIEKLSRELGKK